MTRGGSTNTADSFEDEAIDDAANRPFLCKVRNRSTGSGHGLHHH